MLQRRIIRSLFVLAALAGLAVFLVPRFPAEGFRGRVETALEGVLQRDVTIGELRYTLWGGPGFTLRDVVVADRPEISAEPFAYVNEARVAVSPATLWRQELTLGSITLVQPSVNIAESPGGEGNYDQLLRRGVGEQARSGQPLPRIHVEGARINFRRGLRKSEYYFRNADFRLEEEGLGTDAWLVEFRAEPARTDSVAPRFGTVRGRGRWRAAAGANGEVDVDVEIERSPLAELAALFQLSRVGLNGFVTARAHLSGPAEQAEIRGTLELSDQPGWSFLPLGNVERGIPLEGVADLPGRRLLLRSGMGEKDPPLYTASLAVNPADLPGAWRASVDFRDLPVRQALDLMRYASDSTPDGLQLAGGLDGSLSYRSGVGLAGTVSASMLRWESGEQAPFGLRDLQVTFEGQQLRGESVLQLDPDAALEGPSGPEFRFTLDGASGGVALTLAGAGMTPAHVDALGILAPAVSSRPALLEGKRWRASGVASWQRESSREAGNWAGALQVRDADLVLPELRRPVVIQSATLDLKPRSWHARAIQGRIGDVTFGGDWRHSPTSSKPNVVELRFAKLALEDLVQQLRPLAAEQGSFLRRAFTGGGSTRRGAALGRVLQAKIYIETVLIGDSTMEGMEGDLFVDRDWLEFRNIRVGTRFGPVSAYLEGDLGGESPEWNWKWMGGGGPWMEGTVRVESSRHAVGDLSEILQTAAGTEILTWNRGPGAAQGVPTMVRARLRWEAGRAEPVLAQDGLEVRMNRAVWLGSCNQSNGTGYVCRLEDPRTGEQRDWELPRGMVGLARK